ncbi:MAG: hypothetical protein HY824_03255 [Acidobacteria bacterium]|nr:hypothetical protein [Acidobacteriota bacterium]
MKYTFGAAAVLGTLLLGGVSLSAHHALQAQFDTEKPLSLKGTLSRMEWINPHAYFWFDVKDDKGEVKQWGAETVGPAALRQAGFLRGPASFRIGDTYTFEGFSAKDGGERIFTTAILFADGRKVQIWFGDASGQGGPAGTAPAAR